MQGGLLFEKKTCQTSGYTIQAKVYKVFYEALFLPFISSILPSIFWAKATSWGVGGLFLLSETAAAGLEAALKVTLMGVWARDPPELVGLGAPLELGAGGPLVVELDTPDVEGVLEGAGKSIWYWNKEKIGVIRKKVIGKISQFNKQRRTSK